MTTHWALTYLGKPWQSGANGPHAYDCYGLVRAVIRDRFGITMPAIDADATRTLACLHAARDFPDYDQWQQVDVMAEGDVLQMGAAKRPHHVGIYAGSGRVLHCVEGAGVLLQPIDSLRLHGWNILQTYRRRT